MNYEANFSFFILLHKRAKPIQPPYIILPPTYPPIPPPPRILLPCFANAKPLPEAGNNYLGSECDHLPEALFLLFAACRSLSICMYVCIYRPQGVGGGVHTNLPHHAHHVPPGTNSEKQILKSTLSPVWQVLSICLPVW